MFASAAIYDLKQENVLTSDPNHAFFNLQTGAVAVKGVELEEVARFHERVSINASYSYTHSEVTRSNGPDLGKELPVVPKNKLSFFADYTQQTGPWLGSAAEWACATWVLPSEIRPTRWRAAPRPCWMRSSTIIGGTGSCAECEQPHGQDLRAAVQLIDPVFLRQPPHSIPVCRAKVVTVRAPDA